MSKTRRGSIDLQRRRSEAAERQAERDLRSPQEQLRFLDQILGAGKGAKKERARLEAQVVDVKKKFDEAVAPTKPGKGKK